MFKRIRTKMTGVFLAVTLIPTIIAAFLVILQTESALTDDACKLLCGVSENVKDDLERFVSERMSDVHALARGVALAGGNASKISEAINSFYESGIYDDVTVVNADGNVVASIKYKYVGEWASNNWFVQAREGQDVISDVYFLFGEPVISFFSPVVMDDKVVAVVTAQMSMKYIWDIVDAVKVGESGFVYLIDKNGRIISHPDKQMIFNRAYIEHPSDDHGFLTQDGLLCGYSAMFNGSWIVVAAQPEDEALAILFSLKRSIAATLSIISLFSAIGVFLLARGITKPITELTSGIESVAAGDLSWKVDVRSEDELGTLAASFNKMTEELMRARAEIERYARALEEKVEERTRDLRRAYEELKRLDEAKTRFISIAAHELRTPLTVIMGYMDVLKGADGEDVMIKAMKSAAKRLADAIDHIVLLTMLELEEYELTKEELALADMVKETYERFRDLAEKKNQKISFELEDAKVKADREAMMRIIYNLLSNAVKFTPDGGLIKISVKECDDTVLLMVADTGIGIPDDEKERIFMPFHQMEYPLTRSHGGLGLGLPTVRRLVELHGGKIWVEDNPKGGSIFFVEIPKSK